MIESHPWIDIRPGDYVMPFTNARWYVVTQVTDGNVTMYPDGPHSSVPVTGNPNPMDMVTCYVDPAVDVIRTILGGTVIGTR